MQPHGAQCNAFRKDGSRCEAAIVLPSGFCPMHDPDRQAEVAAIRRAGGHGKATSSRLARRVPPSLRPVLTQLLDGIGEVHDGTLAPGQASGMAALATAAVRIFAAVEVEERLA